MDLTIVVRNLTNMAIDEYKNVRFALTLTALFRFFRPSFQPGLPKSQNFRTFQYHFSHYGVILFWFDLLTVGRVKASAMGVMSTIETLGSSRDWVQSSDWEGRKKLPGLPRKQPTEQAVYWARDGSIPHWSRESPRNRKIQVDGNVSAVPYCGVLSKWEFFINMRAAFLAPSSLELWRKERAKRQLSFW